ncbi:MAG: hypothetical protein HYU56_04420 [Candidatus Aenigmarchaeota archaeon]|nr:hypothetical protein [Candidatus Aenigmarchaeota archaeon]
MAFEDIGQLIFVQLLQMTDYPGSPFTGDIARDLIMFLLVPSVFIILVVYMMVGRVLPPDARYNKLRVLLGATTYLFIIAGGYYRTFALLAGPYFIFLIFVLGILFFFIEHFGRRGHELRSSYGGRGNGSHSASTTSIPHYENMGFIELNKTKKRIQARLADVTHEIREAEAGKVEEDLTYLRKERVSLQQELREVERQLNLGKRMGF